MTATRISMHFVSAPGRRAFVVTDSNVGALYGAALSTGTTYTGIEAQARTVALELRIRRCGYGWYRGWLHCWRLVADQRPRQ